MKRVGSNGAKDTVAGGWWLRSVRVATFAVTLSVCIAVSVLTVFGLRSSVASGAAFPAGVALGVLAMLPIAGVVSLPMSFRGAPGAVVACLLALPLFFGRIGGALYHAALGRLPGFRSAILLADAGPAMQSVRAHAPPLLIGTLLVFSLGTPLVLTHLLAPRLATAFARVRPAVRYGGLAGVLVVGSVAFGIATQLEGQVYFGAVSPWYHLALTYREEQRPLAPPPKNDEELSAVAGRVRSVMGLDAPEPPLDSRYPYCRAPRAGRDVPSRSAILLILESVNARVMDGRFDGAPLAPQLRRIANDSLSFHRFFASGDRSSQALVSILSGLPVVTHRRVLDHAPMVRLRGFPQILRDAGARTVYLHGGDLSFEQQRAYLRIAGYEEIIEPNLLEVRGEGWGPADGVMYERTKAWITAARRTDPNRPYLATMFTLSTHDPYTLPKGTSRRFVGDDAFSRFADSVLYADEELGKFYDWYVEQEKPKGTLLLITGDHSPRPPFPGDPSSTSTGELEHQFQVPFVIAGLGPEEIPPGAAKRPGGHLDIAQTLLGALGVPTRDCLAGRNLLDPQFPKTRVIPSMAGESLEILYLHDGNQLWENHLRTGELKLFDSVADPLHRTNLFRPHHPAERFVRGFSRDYLALGYYLNIGNHFAPPVRQAPATRAVAPLSEPLVVSHRGNVDGPAANVAEENTRAAVQRAVERGFGWVEIDVGITSDGVVVLNHDARLGEGSAGASEAGTLVEDITHTELESELGRPVATLESILEEFGRRISFCVELKVPQSALAMMDLVQGALTLLERLPGERPVIVDSFSRTMMARVRETISQMQAAGTRRSWQVGYDLPQKPVQDEWLTFSAAAGFDWVYLHERMVTSDVVSRAHRLGLRVMAYPVNEAARGATLRRWGVDATMTDSAALLR